jgi:very-short-patch-repair endonuclease
VFVRPHVYRLAGAAPTWRQAVCAATLVAGPTGRASHETAAALAGVPGFPAASSTPIVLTVARGCRPPLRGIRIHQSTILSAAHVGVVDDIRVTSLARTLCDLDGRVYVPRLGALVDEMLVRRAVTMAELRAVHAALRHGRRWSRGMAHVLAMRGDEAERAGSTREADVVRWLRDAGLPPPVQQHEVAGYHVDLAYPDEQVLIEFDGFAAHSTRSAFDRDRRRQNDLLVGGGAVLVRFTSTSTQEEVVRTVATALGRAS